MATTLISHALPPNIDITKAPIAYGDRALPKLNRELHDSELVTRQRALMALCDVLHDPEHTQSALNVGIVASLKDLLEDPDVTVRYKSLEALYIISCHSVGREAFIAEGVIQPVAKLFDDEEASVRQNAHIAVETVSRVNFGAVGVVQAGLVKVLVDKLQKEHDEIKQLILDTLHFCLRVNTADALEANAMVAFSHLLCHSLPSIRSRAARDIMDLSVPLLGKEKALEVEVMPQLVKLLKDKTMDVKANAAGAIMFIAITTAGKYAALYAGAVDALVDLIMDDDSNSEVKLNSIKAVTCLSEAPEGRKSLLAHVDKLAKLRNDESLAVQTSVDIAIKVITWKP